VNFEIRRDDLHSARFVESEAPEPAEGEAVLSVDRVGLTANNITYAVFGEAMNYWDFFPASEPGRGRLPVWGFGEVAASNHPDLEAGTRVYGYFSLSDSLLVQPGRVDAKGFIDASPHREPLPSAYQGYRRTDADPVYDEKREDEQIIFWPLFYTSFLIDDFLQDEGFFGAETMLLSSASSKTAIIAAFLLAQREGIEVVGLTSPGNKEFVEGLGIYSSVSGYDEIDSLPRDKSVYVDMSGDGGIRASVHQHLGDARARRRRRRDPLGPDGHRGRRGAAGSQAQLLLRPDADQEARRRLGHRKARRERRGGLGAVRGVGVGLAEGRGDQRGGGDQARVPGAAGRPDRPRDRPRGPALSSPANRVVDAVDGYQRRHSWLGFPLAVAYKFGDDQGPYLTALITYYGFLSLFPMMLLLVTVLGYVLEDDPELQQKLVDSTIAELPILRGQLADSVESLKGSGVGLAVGVLGTLYGTLGAAGATQNAFNRAWAVPRHRRPNPFALRARSLLLLAVLGVGVIVTTVLSGLTTSGGTFGEELSWWLSIAALPLATLANIGLFLIAFRVLTASDVPARELRIGAVVAGVGWQIVQVVGTYLLSHALTGAPEAYGVFGLVLGLIAWIYFLSFVVVFAAEVSVVHHRRLWPRALLTPFTDSVQLTAADERAYTGYAESELHKGFEVVDVGFDKKKPDEEEEPG
jgi:membrane protein